MSKYTLLYLYMVACVAVLLTACDRRTVYDHYEHTPLNGWEKNDTLVFETDPIEHTGRYMEEIGIRINGDYPFMGLNLVVEQMVLPSEEAHTKSLTCQLVDERGNAKGRGVSHYQYMFHLTTLRLNRGDRLRVAVRHDMKREILPGISDIGIRLQKTEARD